MRISELAEQSLDHIKQLKERGVEKHGAPDDIHPIVEAWRGNDPIVMLHLQQHDRDVILHAASIAAAGYDADALVLCFETYREGRGAGSRPGWLNPMTGRRYRSGEMQDVAQNHGGIEKGWVTEALSAMVANRAGDTLLVSQNYGYRDGHVVWGDRDVMDAQDENSQLSGLMVSAMVKAMNAPSGSQLLPISEELFSRAERDVLTTHAIGSRHECAVMLFADVSDARRIAILARAVQWMSSNE